MPALVVTDNLTITKGTTTVLQSVALGLADGDRIGVVGRNGAGKSTSCVPWPARRARIPAASPCR